MDRNRLKMHGIEFLIANVLQSSVSGNLELNITDDELKKIFGRYGKVEDVDIKRPPPNSGETYFHIF